MYNPYIAQLAATTASPMLPPGSLSVNLETILSNPSLKLRLGVFLANRSDDRALRAP